MKTLKSLKEGIHQKALGAAVLAGALHAALPGDEEGYKKHQAQVQKKVQKAEKERKDKTVTLKQLKAHKHN